MYTLMKLYFNYFNTSYTKYGYLNLIFCFDCLLGHAHIILFQT